MNPPERVQELQPLKIKVGKHKMSLQQANAQSMPDLMKPIKLMKSLSNLVPVDTANANAEFPNKKIVTKKFTIKQKIYRERNV